MAKNEAEITPLLLSVNQGAQAVGLGTTKFRELLATGQVKSLRVGVRVLVPRQELEAWIARACEVDESNAPASR